MTVKTELLVDRDVVTQYSRNAGEPEWMLSLRLKALDQVENLELPKVEKTRINNWNFTQFHPFAEEKSKTNLNDLPAVITELIGEDEAENLLIQEKGSVTFQTFSAKLKEQGIIFTDLGTALREHGELVEKYFMKSGVNVDDDRLTALHTALWSGGLFIYVPKNTVVDVPLLSLFAVEGDQAGLVPHVLIAVEDNSQLNYVEYRISTDDEGNNVHNGISEVFVGANSKVTFAGVNRFGKNTIDYSKRVAQVKRDGKIEWAFGETGDSHAVSSNHSILLEQGAAGDSKIVSIGDGAQRGNYTSKMHHIGPHTTSHVLSKGVLLEESAQVFNGITKMIKGAYGADGDQTERLLMLSPKARGDANPILLIDENDVKCGHAASVGQIDELQLFYLMSRGISRAEAERMIIRGFLAPVVSEIPLEFVRNKLMEAMERKLN